MFVFVWSFCGRKLEYPKESHLSILMITRPFQIPTPGIKPRAQPIYIYNTVL